MVPPCRRREVTVEKGAPIEALLQDHAETPAVLAALVSILAEPDKVFLAREE